MKTPIHPAKTFMRCSICGKQWITREEFLSDKAVLLDGYQWNSVQVLAGLPPEGVLVFTHSRSDCGASLAVAPKVFKREQGG